MKCVRFDCRGNLIPHFDSKKFYGFLSPVFSYGIKIVVLIRFTSSIIVMSLFDGQKIRVKYFGKRLCVVQVHKFA